MKETINVIVRILPQGDELDVELPIFSTGKDILDELLAADLVPKADPQGNPYSYQLITKDRGSEVDYSKTLTDQGVRDGNTLLLAPKLVAGFF